MKINLADPSFEISKEFLEQYYDKQPAWGPIGEVTYRRTYSRKKDDGSGETYVDTLERVVNGTFSIQKNHCSQHHLPWSDDKAQRTAQAMFAAMWEFKFLPPGQGLRFMGTDAVRANGGAVLNNCAFVSTQRHTDKDLLAPFQFVMDMLMLGVGVGFDTCGSDTLMIYQPITPYALTYVEDTRSGWVNSLSQLLASYMYPGKPEAIFSYDLVRPRGTPLKTFGGTASGPGPLKDLHASVRELCNLRVGSKLSSIDIVDIMNFIGKCVVSGNIRRSAENALGDWRDQAFLTMKQDSSLLQSHRWASNNSVVIRENGCSYKDIVPYTIDNGEPGYFWLDNARQFGRMKEPPNGIDSKVVGCNPCFEQSLESYEVCNLVETFPSRHTTLAEYLDTVKLAYLYAKTVTLVPTHVQETNAVMLRNRRIGCSQSGIVRAFNKHGRRTLFQWCDTAYGYIQGLDKQYSSWLCIPESIKKTSIKPSGTVSLLPGETPGIHYPHSQYYIRRIRFDQNSLLVPPLRKAGYMVVQAATDNSSVVVEFPVHEPYFERGKDSVSMWEQLENAAAYQYWWADNQVSITVTFTEDEAKDIKHALELYESRLKAVSFLPLMDHKYSQAPYETITEDQYKEMSKTIRQIQWPKQIHSDLVAQYCDSESCLIREI